MRYEERDDGELLELAEAGWAPAFAVLVHRHAPALLAAFADDPDPVERVTDVFVRAMRQLGERGHADAVGPWLFALAGRPAPRTVPTVSQETLDPIWRHLALLWPDGRHVHHPARPIRRKVLTVVGAIALGVAVPTIVLGLPASPVDESAESVRAQPLDDDPTEEVEREDLPSFEFPDVGGGTETETSPTDRPVDTDAEPTSDPSPTAPLVPDPPTEPSTEPTAEPTTEPTGEPTTEPTTEPVDPPPTTEPVDPPPTDDGDGGDGGTDGGDGGDGGDVDGGSGTLPIVRGDDS